LIGKGYSTKFGARPLRRTIEDELEHRIAEGILGSEYQKGAILEVRMDKGVLQIEPRNESDK
jgi:ATP-dependent Clp protease ATP-binding subunit ClpC